MTKNNVVQKNKKPNQGSEILRSYWLYGIHSVRAALQNNNREIKRMIGTKPALEKLREDYTKRKIFPEILSPYDITRILPEEAVHQGAAVEVKPFTEVSLEMYLSNSIIQKPLILLDQVSDPHNVGAILRSAAAFDAGAVITTKDNAPHESAILAKASCGGIEIIPFIKVTNLSQSMELLKQNGFWCVGLEGEASQTIAEARLNKKTALILGAEGRGLRRLTSERCDIRVRLPISPAMESLNVSNAAAIALYAISQSIV